MIPRDLPHSPSSSRADSPGLELTPDPGGIWNPTGGEQEESEIAAADKYILGLVQMFARVVQALAKYDCQTAIDELENLPPEQQHSAWVYTLMGRASYEMVDYEKVCPQNLASDHLIRSALTPIFAITHIA